MREISERSATMVAVRRRGEADASSVRGQKERMTIAVETRELNPGRSRERESREEGRKCEREEEGERSEPSFAAISTRSFRFTPQ